MCKKSGLELGLALAAGPLGNLAAEKVDWPKELAWRAGKACLKRENLKKTSSISLLTLIVGGSLSSTPKFDKPPASPPGAGAGGGIRDAVRSPCRAPCHFASPICGVAGKPAGASVVRGEGLCPVKNTPPLQQPVVIAADFTTLYD
jgi:hypothetical protein